jgi:hypothetical protein
MTDGTQTSSLHRPESAGRFLQKPPETPAFCMSPSRVKERCLLILVVVLVLALGCWKSVNDNEDDFR